VITSDSFNRADASEYSLGPTDLSAGGTTTYYYIPVFAAGASISGGVLRNNGLDYGGVQLTTSSSTGGTRGSSVGQDLDMSVDLLVPTDGSGNVSDAGLYFRNRAAFDNDGLLGGASFDPSGGYWVRLLSTGKIEVVDMRNGSVVASTSAPASFDTTVFHHLAIAFKGSSLQVTLDGVLQSFHQGGNTVTNVSIPPTALPGDTAFAGDAYAGDAGTVGIAFGSPNNRGQIGGQEAENLVITGYSALG
jgi:hypothetical protein